MSAESNKLEKDFWKAYKAEDFDKCKEMYTGLPAEDDFDTAAVAATMSLALNSEDVCERFDRLLGFLADTETQSIDFDDREVYFSIIMDCLDKAADCSKLISFPEDLLDSVCDLKVTGHQTFYGFFYRPAHRAFIRKLEDRIKYLKKPMKVNIYLSYFVYSLHYSLIYDNLLSAKMSVSNCKYTLDAVVNRKSMSGETEYSEYLRTYVTKIEDILANATDRAEDGKYADIKEGTDMEAFYNLVHDLSMSITDPVAEEQLEKHLSDFKDQMENNLIFIEFPKFDRDEIENHMRKMLGQDADEEDTEEESERDSDISSVTFDMINHKSSTGMIVKVANHDPKDADEVMKVCMAAVILAEYEEAYRLYVDSIESYPELEQRMDDLIDFIADDVAYCYLHDARQPTYGHVDILAEHYGGTPVEFFMRFGARVMSHLKECRNASACTDLPDAYAMYSRYIFDCSDISGVIPMFRDIAKAYRDTEAHIRKNKRRFPNSERFTNLCDHSAKVYDGMVAYLEDEFEDGQEYLDMPPIFAGHSFDHAFYSWFMQRDMQGGAHGKKVTDRASEFMAGVLRSLVHDDEDE